ncbi:conserved hypothetical Ustilaginaceae_specific protein [Sporisorium reilianum SRZ2]|uniref:Conserved hypothetical Ustilaginaceae_specific protein n=1 Tax=Sporisorium reilianum (strain SRZ2) TaxID=999809 RepID=E6ZS86_SPORE|nr:conserved hypothetical Ustilaginaceae_specific protein [Sporisorium reilianum SRZ2]
MTGHLLVLVLTFSWLSGFNVDAANPGLGINPGAPSSTIHHSMVEQGKAEMAADIVERLFDLPAGHLHPVHGYDPAQIDAWLDHIGSPYSRYAVLKTHRPANPLVLAPRGPWPRTLLFLQVLETGEVVPMGHAVVSEGVPPGQKKDFLQTILEAATTTRQELISKYQIQRFVAPGFQGM